MGTQFDQIRYLFNKINPQKINCLIICQILVNFSAIQNCTGHLLTKCNKNVTLNVFYNIE